MTSSPKEQVDTKRRPRRYQARGAGEGRPYQRTERVAGIIRAVGDHRFITTPQLTALIALQGWSENATRHKLRALFDDRTLMKIQRRAEVKGGGSWPDVYTLADAGAAHYHRLCGAEPPARIRERERNQAIKDEYYIEHQLLTTSVLVAVEQACAARGYLRLVRQREIELPSARTTGRNPFSWSVALTKPRLVLPCVPDAVFGIRDERADPPRAAWFFLEADCGTMDIEPADRTKRGKPNLFHKMAAYAESHRQGKHKELFGFGNVRVLTVTSRTEERLNNICTAATEAAKHASVSTLLFSTERMIKKNDALSSVWISASGDERALTKE